MIDGMYQFGGRTVNGAGLRPRQLTGRNAYGPPADRAQAVRTVRRAVDGGVDHIDTAAYYGRLAATPAVALAWVLAQAPHTLLIPGTSSVAHLEENLAAPDVALDDEALAAPATLAREQ